MANVSSNFTTLADLIQKSAVHAFEEAAAAGIIEAEKEFRATVDLAIAEFEKKAARAIEQARVLAKNTANKGAVQILQDANIAGIRLTLQL